MNILKKSTISITILALFAGALSADEKVINLTLHHFVSAKSTVNTKVVLPWAKQLEKDSNGRIKVSVFPSMTLGGKPNELYKQVRDGTVDIVWTIAGYTPGIFPRTEVFELPTVHIGSALDTSLAIKNNFDLIKDDYKKVKPLLVYVHEGNGIQTVSKKIEKVSDLKGLKLRAPSRISSWYIKELGAEPVGMPLPTLPQALSKNAVDGALFPFELFPAYKFQQLTQYSSEGINKERFGTSVLLLLMNKERFKEIPKELQDIIVSSLNTDLIKKIGKMTTELENEGISLQVKSKGGEVIKISSKAMDEFNEAGERVVQKWIKDVSKKGIDGQKLVNQVRKSILEVSKHN